MLLRVLFFCLTCLLLISSVACRQGGGDSPTPTAPDAAVVVVEGTAAPTQEPAAAEATATPEPTPTSSPTPTPPKDLIVCIGNEPTDLYLYGDESPSAVAVRNALYEPLFTNLGYSYQALALETLPGLAKGDARLEAVEAELGDLIVNSDGEIVPLARGTEVIDADGQPVVYDQEPISMSQLVVDFTLKPLVWSDGTPVTAEDSVFSFQLAGDRATPQLDDQVRYTAEYRALDERTVRWVGLPGYLDPAYMTHVWTPLPRHQLRSSSAAEMPSLDEAARTPLSYGPFLVESWTPGTEIRLAPNPYYYRLDEGLPHLTSVTFRFLTPGNTDLPAGYEPCHIITQDVLAFDALAAVEATGGALVPHTAALGVVEQIIFGIDSIAEYAADHIDWFEDARVRQAVAQCIDRQGMVDDLMSGRAAVLDSYVPADHPLLPDDTMQWPYDPAEGNRVLDELGYVDADGDGVRNDIASTAAFSVTLGTNNESPLRMRIIEMAQRDLAECGITANIYGVEAGTWFAPGPAGTVFGRKFDLAQFAWLVRNQPDCGLYLSDNIPGPQSLGFNSWSGTNVAGWSNEAYDNACRAAQALLPGQPGYPEAYQDTLRIFAEELPAVPLFTRMRLAAAKPEVLNFRLDPTQPSELWNLFELDLTTGGS